MKSKEKKLILVLILITIVVVIVGLTVRNILQKSSEESQNKEEVVQEGQDKNENVKILEDGTRENTSEKLKEPKMIEGLELREIRLTEKENVSEITGKIKNNTEEAKGEFTVTITLKDKEGKEITKIGGIIGKVEAGEEINFKATATYDFANAYDFTIERN